MFKIIKKTSAVWQHELNGQIIHLSSFGVVADISLQTFILRALNGSYFPNQSVGIANIIVIDETDASVEESFGTINELLNRLIELNYTPYIVENAISLNLQQITDNGATTTNPIATGNLTIDEVGGGDPCITTNQSLTDGGIISVHLDTDSEFGISVRFPSSITGNRNIDYPDANGTIATEEWVLDNLPAGGVESVNTQTGVVVLDADDISDSATTNKFVTSAEKSTWNGKQNALVSGTNIKTIEGQSLLGSGNIDLTKSDVGLGNVDNTSDANKPISTATQTALNLKSNLTTTPRILLNNNPAITTTGTQTVCGTVQIDNLGTAWSMDVNSRMYKAGTTSLANLRVYLNDTPNLSGSPTLLGISSIISATNRFQPLDRTFEYSGGVLRGINASNSVQSDESVTSGQTELALTINLNNATTRYFVFSIERTGTAGDTVECRFNRVILYPNV